MPPASDDGKADVASNSEPPAHERTRLLHDSVSVESLRESSPPPRNHRRPGRFFEDLAEGLQKRDRDRLKREIARYLSFIWAIACSGCAGSITAYSLYGPLFLSRLKYTQYRVNLVSIVGAAATYGPVPLSGFLIDRCGPHIGSSLAGITFGIGYILAAFTYRSGPPPDAVQDGTGWPFGSMLLAFVFIGASTSSMHIAGMTTCAKNFGRAKYRGFALSAPIAAFGLSGFWQAQVGSRLLTKGTPEGDGSELDVFRFFIFLGVLLAAVGVIGFFLLRVLDEEELLDEAVEELERSGFLDDSEFLHSFSRQNSTYGTISSSRAQHQTHDAVPTTTSPAETRLKATAGAANDEAIVAQSLRKTKVLNAETKRFLTDRTMWWFAAGFFLVTGPGEAFINNLGTIIGTLYPPPASDPTAPRLPWTPPATHVSIVAICSTLARLLAGALSDLLAPQPLKTPRGSVAANGPSASIDSSLASLDPLGASNSNLGRRRFRISRMSSLLFASALFSIGFALLASGIIQHRAASRFWIVSATAGLGYGASFSLVPIIISCVWGVENFATNFGVIAIVPAFGAAMWGLVYSAEYEAGAGSNGLCYGLQCYRITFWGEAVAVWVAMVLWLVAWKGPGGWTRKGVFI